MNGAEAVAAATAAASRRWLRLWTNLHEGALRGSSRGGGGGEGGKKPTQVDHVTTCKKHTSSSFCQTRNSNCRRTHRQHKLKRAIKYAFRRLSRGRDQFTGYHTLTTWHLNSHKTLFINSPTDPSRETVVVCCCFLVFFNSSCSSSPLPVHLNFIILPPSSPRSRALARVPSCVMSTGFSILAAHARVNTINYIFINMRTLDAAATTAAGSYTILCI